MRHTYLPLLLAGALCASPQSEPPRPAVDQTVDQAVDQAVDPTQAELEREFEALMSGCRMVGRFTITGSAKPAQEESYTIAKVKKLNGSKWRFHAKIEYGGRAVTVPIVVDVEWAGDTPMIQVTDMAIPMLGTYSARVLIYRREYAGTWSGKDHGGQMFGKVVKSEPAPPAPAQDKGQGQGQDKDKDEDQDKDKANWGNWRGPGARAIAAAGSPPRTWNEPQGENIKWEVPLPGRGSSSPLVWGDRIYVTTAIPTDRDGAADAGAVRPRGRGGFGGGATPTKIHEFVVLALDRGTGATVWRKTVVEAVPHEGGHATATQASGSSITDGERIYAFFGSRGLHCMDLDGAVLWSKDFGKMRTSNSFGEGTSPALYGDTLVVNWDHEGDSFIAAFDRKTGAERWRTPRRERTTWATPLIVPVGGKPQIITTGQRASRGYDLATGKEIWTLAGLTSNPIPSPLYADGVVYLMSGFRGSALQAVELAGAKGDLRGTDSVLWTLNRNTPYTPSGIVYDGFLYFLRVNSGVLSCLDAKTGKVHYEGKKLRRIGDTYSSIVGANGHIYVTSRRGWTKVIKVGPKYEEVASNRVTDTIDATAAIAGDEIFLRGWENLYCIAKTGAR